MSVIIALDIGALNDPLGTVGLYSPNSNPSNSEQIILGAKPGTAEDIGEGEAISNRPFKTSLLYALNSDRNIARTSIKLVPQDFRNDTDPPLATPVVKFYVFGAYRFVNGVRTQNVTFAEYLTAMETPTVNTGGIWDTIFNNMENIALFGDYEVDESYTAWELEYYDPDALSQRHVFPFLAVALLPTSPNNTVEVDMPIGCFSEIVV